jgi:cell division protein FtsW
MAEKSAISRFLNKPTAAYQTLIVSTIALTVIGIVMVFSSSSIHSLQTKGNSFAIVGRQIFFLIGAAPLAYFMAHQKLATWKLLARFGFAIALALELILRIPGVGKNVNGNTNWIKLGPIDIQPSEFAKFFII